MTDGEIVISRLLIIIAGALLRSADPQILIQELIKVETAIRESIPKSKK